MTNYLGDCTVSTRYPERDLFINRADPHVLVSDDLLAQMTVDGMAGEGMFVVHAVNGTVRYRLVAPEEGCWKADRITDWPEGWRPTRWPEDVQSPMSRWRAEQ